MPPSLGAKERPQAMPGTDPRPSQRNRWWWPIIRRRVSLSDHAFEVYEPIHLYEPGAGLHAPLGFERIRRMALGLILILVAITSSGMGWYWWQSTLAPTWWTTAGELPIDNVRRAEAVERGLTAMIYNQTIRSEPRTVELQAKDANSWLQVRLLKWMANRGDRWPESLSAPRVAFEDGRISVGVRVLADAQNPDKRHIVSLGFTPELSAIGSLRLIDADARVGRARLGGLAADIASVAGRRASAGGTPIEALIEEAGGLILREILLGKRPAMDPALVDLDDGRQVRIIDIRVIEDRLRVVYISEMSARASAH